MLQNRKRRLREDGAGRFHGQKGKMLCGVVLLAALVAVGAGAIISRETSKVMTLDSIGKQVGSVGEHASVASGEGTAEPGHTGVKGKDFAALKEQNGDIYAWIEIPGTGVDYAVVQNAVDDYYLKRNLDGSEGYPGCIYTNACNAKDFSDYNTVIYGHNMKDGTMFASLHKYEDKAFFAENQLIYIYQEDRTLTYRVYAATAYNDDYLPTVYQLTSYSGVDAFIQTVNQGKYADGLLNLNEELQIAEGDKIITLSTCIKGQDTKRFLVIGVLQEG